MRRWLVLFILLGGGTSTVWAQQQPLAEGEMLRINTALVTLNVGVSDKQGRALTQLRAEDFAVYEDGRLQPLEFFGAEDQPISFGLLLDRSQSMSAAGKLTNAIEVAMAFLRAGNPQNDAFCLAFNEVPSLMSDFTSDYSQIGNRLVDLVGQGGTALYDAILAGLDKLTTAKHRRRALIVITDGRDEHSRYTLDDLLKRAQAADVQIYMVGFFSPVEAEAYRAENATVTMMDGSQVDNPRVVFQTLATETGAESYFPKTAAELTHTVASIATSLRRMYVLGYYPIRQERDDRYRRLEVKVRNVSASQIKTRQGYRLTEPLPSNSTVSSLIPDKKPATAEGIVLTLTPRAREETVPLLYRETFDQPNSQWLQTEKTFINNGKYHVHGEAVVPVPPFRYQNFELSVSTTQSGAVLTHGISVSELATIGLSFRVNSNGYYELTLAPIPDKHTGIFTLSKVVNGRSTILQRLDNEQAIGLNNRIKVRCQGAKIEVFINGLLVSSLKDDAHTRGTISLLFNGKRATFDDLTIKRLD